jgi:DNA invertase Pin-like site-specific DNA recombinase
VPSARLCNERSLSLIRTRRWVHGSGCSPHWVDVRRGVIVFAVSTFADRGLQLHVLGAIAEFERERSRERVRAGLARARAQGKRLGRRRLFPVPSTLPKDLTVRAAAAKWGVSKSTAARWLSSGQLPMGQTSAAAWL